MGVREGVGNRRCFLKDLDLDGGEGGVHRSSTVLNCGRGVIPIPLQGKVVLTKQLNWHWQYFDSLQDCSYKEGGGGGSDHFRFNTLHGNQSSIFLKKNITFNRKPLSVNQQKRNWKNIFWIRPSRFFSNTDLYTNCFQNEQKKHQFPCY